MSIDEVKNLIDSARSIEREAKRMKEEIEALREELTSIKSALGGSVVVKSSEQTSPQERVYFRLEELYKQYSATMQSLCDKRAEIEVTISQLDYLEQEIVRAWIDGKTEEQIGEKVGYSRSSIQRTKRRILVKIANIVKDDAS